MVLFAGLPPDKKDMVIWQELDPGKRPALVLTNSALNDLKKAIKKGFISVVLTNKVRSVDFEKPIPENETEAFDERFLLITLDTIDAIDKENPKLFGR